MISKFSSIYHLFISIPDLLDGLSCSARDQISQWKCSLCSPRTLCWFLYGWNLIDFIAANLHFIREQEQKESPSCFYNCPCGTFTRSLCSSLFPAPVLSGGFLRKIWSLKKSRRASEYLSWYHCHTFCTGNPAHTPHLPAGALHWSSIPTPPACQVFLLFDNY